MASDNSAIQKKDNLLVSHPWFFLFLLYIIGVGIRFSLGFLFRQGPTLTIDESLYINLAKSLAAGEGIAYRSQPIPYMYIFYPLLLIPLYLFPLPFDLFRVIQLWNALLISTSVFPVFLFAKDFTGSRKKALLASLLVLLMPDMQISGYLMAESILWPLSMWLVFFACRLFLFEKHLLMNGIFTGIITALLFWTKPGSLIMGLVFLLTALFLGNQSERLERRPAVVAGLAVCGGMITGFYLLYVYGFGYDMSILGLYNKQLTEVSTKWFAAVAEFSLLQLILFAMACGGLFFVIPFIFYKQFDRNKRAFFTAFSIGLATLAVGTASFVDMFGWNNSFTNPQLHLRYMAMYIPVMFIFSLATSYADDKKNLFSAVLGIMALLFLFPGAGVGSVEGSSTPIDSLALSAWLKPDLLSPVFGIFMTVLTVLCLSFIIFLIVRGRHSSVLRKFCFSFFAVFLLIQNICGYLAGNVGAETFGYGSDAVEMNSLLEQTQEDVLVITQQHYDDILSYALESRLRKPCQQVTVDAMVEALSDTDGVYVPFVPEDQSPNVGNHLTPETDTFLFGITVAEHIEFSPYAQIHTSQNGWYTFAQVPDGYRLADSMLHGLDTHTLPEGKQAQLYIFDDDRYQKGRLTLSLMACSAEGSVDLIVENAGRSQTLSLSSDPFIYRISLYAGDTFFTPSGGDALILTYQTD